jgi:hypothetical protein
MIVALSIGAALLTALATLVTSSMRWHRSIASRAEGLEVARTVWAVLDEELSSVRQGRDWALDPDGVLHLRAFRGFGRACSGAAGSDLVVAFRGERLPGVNRDSVLVLRADGQWSAAPLSSVGPAPSAPECVAAPGESLLRVTGPPEGAQPAPVVLRFFERGSYHLEDGAFRYRRGGGGRQPLTAERIGPSSAFSVAGRALAVNLEVLDEILDSDDVPTTKVFEWRVVERGLPP